MGSYKIMSKLIFLITPFVFFGMVPLISVTPGVYPDLTPPVQGSYSNILQYPGSNLIQLQQALAYNLGNTIEQYGAANSASISNYLLPISNYLQAIIRAVAAGDASLGNASNQNNVVLTMQSIIVNTMLLQIVQTTQPSVIVVQLVDQLYKDSLVCGDACRNLKAYQAANPNDFGQLEVYNTACVTASFAYNNDKLSQLTQLYKAYQVVAQSGPLTTQAQNVSQSIESAISAFQEYQTAAEAYQSALKAYLASQTLYTVSTANIKANEQLTAINNYKTAVENYQSYITAYQSASQSAQNTEQFNAVAAEYKQAYNANQATLQTIYNNFATAPALLQTPGMQVLLNQFASMNNLYN